MSGQIQLNLMTGWPDLTQLNDREARYNSTKRQDDQIQLNLMTGWPDTTQFNDRVARFKST